MRSPMSSCYLVYCQEGSGNTALQLWIVDLKVVKRKFKKNLTPRKKLLCKLSKITFIKASILMYNECRCIFCNFSYFFFTSKVEGRSRQLAVFSRPDHVFSMYALYPVGYAKEKVLTPSVYTSPRLTTISMRW